MAVKARQSGLPADPWYFPRGELTAEVMRLFGTGLVRRIALFAPRRKGKTWFVLRDLAPAAAKRQILPVYVSLWSQPEAPHEAILAALARAREFVAARRKPWQRYLRQLNAFTLSAGPVGVQFLTRRLDPRAASGKELEQVASELGNLCLEHSAGPVLLLLDEAQHLASNPAFTPLTSALRTALDSIEAVSAGGIQTLFTGSSRTNLARLLNDPQAPLYQSTERLELPDLDRGYTRFLASQLRTIGQIKVDPEDCWETFQQLDRSPFLMEGVIRALLLRRATSLSAALEYVRQRSANNPALAAEWGALRPLDRSVYLAVCGGASPYAEATLAALTKELGAQIKVADVQNALRRLSRRGLVSTAGRGNYRNEHAELLLWATAQHATSAPT